jgi:ribonuclease-3
VAAHPPLDRLFAQLGGPLDRARIEQALTHPSAAGRSRPHYERLEFLGDRVLGLIVAEALLERRPEEDEGALAPRFNALVRKETCAEVAREIGLGEHLRLERGEARSGGRKRLTILGDAMEAVIAALYLERGLEAARAFVLAHWGPRLSAQGAQVPEEAKTALQEWAQARGLPPPDYVETAREGPDHAPSFTVEARLADGRRASAAAASKRAAARDAAATLLAEVRDG